MVDNRIENLLGVKFCSYCGIYISSTTAKVEHYRPKNRIDARKQTTHRVEKAHYTSKVINSNGYTFFGGDYLNLLIACDACNTGQGHDLSYVIDPDRVKHVKTIEHKYGKHNLFPICNKKSTRSARKKQYNINSIIKEVQGEKPLLLNPYFDDYYDYYDFNNMNYYDSSIRKIVILIKEKSGNSKFKTKKAKTSINIYGLNRVDLCIARGEKYDTMERAIEDLDFSISRYEVNNSQSNLNKVAFGLNVYLSNINFMRTGNHEVSDFYFPRYHVIFRDRLRMLFPQDFIDTNSDERIIEELKAFVHYHLQIDTIMNSVSIFERRR
ncbi:hypothetical protein BCT53_08890 [Vibrio lentus]|nr:hypothetical protein BCT88_03115 [Vibrio lentus]PMM26518.1 hypothetical protein BCT57_18050 [Vibrio lentus]PMM47037.1 hypothetical protein BCT53_08890 [Vibrio lentus]